MREAVLIEAYQSMETALVGEWACLQKQKNLDLTGSSVRSCVVYNLHTYN